MKFASRCYYHVYKNMIVPVTVELEANIWKEMV